METKPLHAVIETPLFIARARKLLSDADVKELVSAVATDPLQGDVMEGTGGARKMRWARPGTGKRGGCRVVYFHHSADVPIFLLDIYGKNEKANLSKAERNELARILTRIVEAYREGVREHVESR